MEPFRFLCSRFAISIVAELANRYWAGRIEGLEKLPSTPSIIIANHESYLDFLLLGYILDRIANRPFAFWAKSRMVRNQPWAILAEEFPCIEVGGQAKARPALNQTKHLLKEGWDICIFPEGRRTRSGRLGSFNEGYLIAAKEMDVPIVPVFIDKAFETWPPHRTLLRIKPCTLCFHDAIETESIQSRCELSQLNATLRQRYLHWKKEEASLSHAIS